ncbi:hypothetical protein CCUS01_06221 [Colletotrichum cuscutae]|uniref:Uncharacterized protein n=1 Tax=Colletotrichum cuscutae TaxID=1209917 RepID=A0AAI9Y4X2_9PEZI|nr:hypothetical protein CCUS01_06221 [Colletotrichum cuscutae]
MLPLPRNWFWREKRVSSLAGRRPSPVRNVEASWLVAAHVSRFTTNNPRRNFQRRMKARQARIKHHGARSDGASRTGHFPPDATPRSASMLGHVRGCWPISGKLSGHLPLEFVKRAVRRTMARGSFGELLNHHITGDWPRRQDVVLSGSLRMSRRDGMYFGATSCNSGLVCLKTLAKHRRQKERPMEKESPSGRLQSGDVSLQEPKTRIEGMPLKTGLEGKEISYSGPARRSQEASAEGEAVSRMRSKTGGGQHTDLGNVLGGNGWGSGSKESEGAGQTLQLAAMPQYPSYPSFGNMATRRARGWDGHLDDVGKRKTRRKEVQVDSLLRYGLDGILGCERGGGIEPYPVVLELRLEPWYYAYLKMARVCLSIMTKCKVGWGIPKIPIRTNTPYSWRIPYLTYLPYTRIRTRTRRHNHAELLNRLSFGRRAGGNPCEEIFPPSLRFRRDIPEYSVARAPAGYCCSCSGLLVVGSPRVRYDSQIRGDLGERAMERPPHAVPLPACRCLPARCPSLRPSFLVIVTILLFRGSLLCTDTYQVVDGYPLWMIASGGWLLSPVHRGSDGGHPGTYALPN